MFDLFLELIFPIAEHFAQAQFTLIMDLSKLGTLKELLERLQQLGTEITDTENKLKDKLLESGGLATPETLELSQTKSRLQVLLKRKLHRYLMFVKTVMRMITIAGVKSLLHFGLTKAVDQLMKLCDPKMMDKTFTLEYIKYLGKVLTIPEGSWAQDILEATYLIEIITNRGLFRRGNNLLAGSVSALLIELTKTQYFAIQKAFVEQNRFALDSATEYLYGANQLIKADKLFKAGEGDTSRVQSERVITKIMKNSRSPTQVQVINERNPSGEQFDSKNGSEVQLVATENGDFEQRPMIEISSFQASSANPMGTEEQHWQDESQRVVSHVHTSVGLAFEAIIDPQQTALFEKEFEASKKKSKSKKLCSYDDSDSDDDMFGNGKDHSSPLSRKIMNPAALDGELPVFRRKSSDDTDEMFPGRKRAMEMFARKVSSDSNGRLSANSSENSPPPAQLKLDLDSAGLHKRPFPFDDQDDEEFGLSGQTSRPFPK